jgi:hypothetical protein
MKKSIFDKIEECRLASKELLDHLLESKDEIQREDTIKLFLSETKYNANNTVFDLWLAYGLTDCNIERLDIGFQSYTKLFHLRYSLMEKWIAILFDGEIAFKSFFDLEIEKHSKIRENALKKGIKHIILRVEFGNIAQIIDNHFVNLHNQSLAINTINAAVIKYPTETDQELVAALLSLNTIYLSKVPQLVYWIKKINEVEDQTITDRLHYLNIVINSLKEVEKNTANYQIKPYFKGLNSQFLFSIHKTLDLVDWLCDSNYFSLESNLKKKFQICRLEHGWKSSLSDS